MVLIMRSFWITSIAAFVAILLTGCTHEKPNFIYMPDMVYIPAFKAQKEGSMMRPVPGTVPRDFQPYHFPKDPNDFSGGGYHNPLKRTHAVLARGQALFNTY